MISLPLTCIEKNVTSETDKSEAHFSPATCGCYGRNVVGCAGHFNKFINYNQVHFRPGPSSETISAAIFPRTLQCGGRNRQGNLLRNYLCCLVMQAGQCNFGAQWHSAEAFPA